MNCTRCGNPIVYDRGWKAVADSWEKKMFNSKDFETVRKICYKDGELKPEHTPTKEAKVLHMLRRMKRSKVIRSGMKLK